MSNERRGVDVGVRHSQVQSDYARVPNHILENPDFTGNEIRVYLLIFKNRADFRITQSWIREKSGLSKPSVINILKSLEEKKVLERIHLKKYNEYVFKLNDFPKHQGNQGKVF